LLSGDFESPASTDSATLAFKDVLKYEIDFQKARFFMLTYRSQQQELEYRGRKFTLLRPHDPCELIDLENPEAVIPYWADEWPSSEIALKLLPEYIKNRALQILEIGAGAGTVSVRLNSLFPNYIAADYSVDATAVMEENRKRNGATFQPVALDWNSSPLKRAFPILIGIDILYEQEMIDPVIKFLSDTLTADGKAYLFDPQRFYWEEFKEKLQKWDLRIEQNAIEKSSEGIAVEMIIIGRE
jgi:predicted nicotinamide N-methyase